jgi:hypothetical protein
MTWRMQFYNEEARESWRVTASTLRYQRRRYGSAGKPCSRIIHRLREDAGWACSSGLSASAVRMPAGGFLYRIVRDNEKFAVGLFAIIVIAISIIQCQFSA